MRRSAMCPQPTFAERGATTVAGSGAAQYVMRRRSVTERRWSRCRRRRRSSSPRAVNGRCLTRLRDEWHGFERAYQAAPRF